MIETRYIPEQYVTQIPPAQTPNIFVEQTQPVQITRSYETLQPIGDEPLKVFHRDTSLQDHPDVMMLPLGERGEKKRYKGKPPRQQPVAIGIDHTDGFVGISFPQNASGAEGFHAEPDSHMNSVIIARRENGRQNPPRDRYIILHGSTKAETIKKGEKAHRVVEIYAMHPEDLQAKGGEKTHLRDLDRIGRSHEKGQVVPDQYIGDHLAQRVLHALDADELRVLYAQRAHRIYQTGTRKPLPRQFRQGD